MANPSIPVQAPPATTMVAPPIANLPFVDKNGFLTVPAFSFLQTLWAAIQGQGGIITQVLSILVDLDATRGVAQIALAQLAELQDSLAGFSGASGFDPSADDRLSALENLTAILAKPTGYVDEINMGPIRFSWGSGSPASTVYGSPGDVYLNTAGGSATTLYVKESGSQTNSGWVGK